MGAYQEFREHGELRDEGVRLLYQTVAGVARIRRFPPPEGHEQWNAEAVTETAHEFLAERDGVARMRQIHRLAFDDDSFERLLHQAIRNHLRSRARATEFGALMRRVRSVLEGDERFQRVGGGRGIPRWTLSATGVQEQFTGQIEHLIHVGRAVAGIKEVRWRSDRRRGPIADRESLAMMFEAVLTSANTSLTVRELARVAAARFNLLDPPLLVDVDDALSGPVAPIRDGPAQTIIAAETAADLWSQLTDRERDVYPYLDLSARQAAQYLNLGKSQVAVAQARLKELLARELSDSGGASAVVAQLEGLSETWSNRTLS